MATQPTTSTQPPNLSSFLKAAHEWLGEDYSSIVVKHVLDSRDQLASEIKRALDAAIRNSGVRVPGGQFQHKDVEDAPTHHLQSPLLRRMQSSDDLTEAVLRAWVGSQGDLYESVVQHLQWNDEPTYGPDRKEMTFRGFWDARDWQTNFNQFLADRTGFDRSDVGLMLWYVSGKLPPPHSEVVDPLERVDFEHWKELLMALRPDAPQWEQALEFAAAIGDIVDEKEKQRARDAVNQLKTKVEEIWLDYSEELVYLEKDMGRWGAARNIQPEEALHTLARVNNLESLLGQYRPIRDQAQSRSVESSRAGRRAELEAEIISTVAELEPVFDPSGNFGFPESAMTAGADSPEREPVPVQEEATDIAATLEDTGGMEPADQCEELFPVDLVADEPEPESLTLAPESLNGEPESLSAELEALTPAFELLNVEPEQAQSADVNVSILAGLQSLREDLEQLKEQLSGASSTGDAAEESEEGLPQDSTDSPQETGLAAAVIRAREWYPNRLIFQLNSESWVEGNPYEDHQSVSDALEWLASVYYSARQGELDHGQLSDSLYRACRWKYSSNQHDQAFFQTEGHYRMLVNGRAYFLNETIGKGVGDDPVNTIRIAFYWDRQRERVVVGYIGQHKPDGES